jgi:hypothetical protein
MRAWAGFVICGLVLATSVFAAERRTPHTRAHKANSAPRIHVGAIANGERLIAPEYKWVCEVTGQETWYFPRWFVGHVESGECERFLPIEDDRDNPGRSVSLEHRLRDSFLRRWRWKDDRLWLCNEAFCGPEGPYVASWAVIPPLEPGRDLPAAIEVSIPDRSVSFDEESSRLTEYRLPSTSGSRRHEDDAQLSRLAPLSWDFEYRTMRGHFFGSRRRFFHHQGGFDLVPRADGSWTLFMLHEVESRNVLSNVMSVWDCTIQPVKADAQSVYRTQWTLRMRLHVPWGGPFFVVDARCGKEDNVIGRPNYIVVRESGEAFGLIPRGRLPSSSGEYAEWRISRVTDPVDYLVAILYLEPNLGVYGFGRKFWVRLDTREELRFWACRDVTKGSVKWTDEDGTEHTIGEPFRTVWQCAQVLKEDCVLQETENPDR